MTDKIFVYGLKIKSQETQYGEILKLGIKSEYFMEFLAKHTNNKGYCNIDILKGKSKKWYAQLNTYKKDSSQTPEDDTVMNFESLEDEEIPF